MTHRLSAKRVTASFTKQGARRWKVELGAMILPDATVTMN